LREESLREIHCAGCALVFSAARELRRLVAPAACLVGAFEAGQTGAILEAAHATQLALCDFDRVLGLGVITPAIARMVALAESAGAVAKVSGAGGGDSVIAVADDPARLVWAATLWRDAGFLPLAVERDDQGTRELSQGSAG
jgi:phosphomevalonate kinase